MNVTVGVVVVLDAPVVLEELELVDEVLVVSSTFWSCGMRPRRVMNVAMSSLVYVVPENVTSAVVPSPVVLVVAVVAVLAPPACRMAGASRSQTPGARCSESPG